MNLLNLLRQKYIKGENISLFIKENKDLLEFHNLSQSDAIALSYDLQAGTYVESYLKEEERCKKYSEFIVDNMSKINIFNNLKNRNIPTSICDMGTGESTNFKGLLENCKFKYNFELDSYAMDISLSRLVVAKKFIKSRKTKIIPPQFFVGNLNSIPLLDNSIDILCTSGAIESNKDMEPQIVNELSRVCSQYLVIIEAIYETSSKEQRARMDKYSYITKLRTEFENNPNLDLINEILIPIELCANPLHQTTLLIARKKNNSEKRTNNFSKKKYACPLSHEVLSQDKNYYFSNSGACYPIIHEIPILLSKSMIPFYHRLQMKNN